MPVQHAPSPVGAAIQALERSTREIDQIFAAGGDRLAHGLTLFEGLTERLANLSRAMAGGEMGGTRAQLLAVIGHLRSFSDGLAEESRGLQDITGHSEAASRSLSRVLDKIRFTAAVARSARIEAALVPSSQDVGGFFAQIGSMIVLATQTIETCVADHNRLRSLLAAAAASQRSFAEAYRSALTVLSDKLTKTLDHIDDRQRQNVRLTTEAAGTSHAIAAAVSGAIVALQCGDSTRQRLEHTLFMLRMACDMAAGECAETRALSAADIAGLQALLRQVAVLQLRGTANTMGQEVGEIDAALRMLCYDIAAGRARGQSLNAGEAADGASYLRQLEAELSQASALIARCNAERGQLNQTLQALRGFVTQFHQTARSLSDTVGTIVVIGMNAGLNAFRLGDQGRVLAIVARELKAVADQIAVDAAQLSPILALIQNATEAMWARNSGSADQLSALDSTMQGALRNMQDNAAHLDATLLSFEDDGAAFATTLETARLAFVQAGEAREVILDTAAALAAGPASIEGADPAVLEDVLNRTVWPTYTMVAERQLHRAALDECGMPLIATMPARTEESDDELMLF